MRFQNGDIVKLAKDAEIAGGEDFPKNTTGKIISTSGHFYIRVKFDGVDYDNHAYSPCKENELRLVRRES